jgi:hypothetical protein
MSRWHRRRKTLARSQISSFLTNDFLSSPPFSAMKRDQFVEDAFGDRPNVAMHKMQIRHQN